MLLICTKCDPTRAITFEMRAKKEVLTSNIQALEWPKAFVMHSTQVASLPNVMRWKACYFYENWTVLIQTNIYLNLHQQP